MITTSKLKKDLEFNRSLGNIIDILKTTAIVRFHSFQFKDRPTPVFAEELSRAFEMLKARAIKHPYLFDRKSLPSAIVIVTSDEGFLGGQNTLLVNAGLDCRKSKDDEIIVIGERGARYLEDMKLPFAAFPGISTDVKYSEAEAVANYILKCYRRKFGRIYISYPRFISLTHQRVEVARLLPYEFSENASREAKFARMAEELLMEPSADRVTEMVVEMWVRFRLFEIYWQSKQSEDAARIMHLEGSTQELAAVNQRLNFEYFRRVHAMSDKTIREISAAKVILGKGSAG